VNHHDGDSIRRIHRLGVMAAGPRMAFACIVAFRGTVLSPSGVVNTIELG
jgi:hypothetical protein